MQTLKFTINKQVIKWENPCRKPVEKSKGVVHAQFTFDEEWSGLNPTIVFDNDFAIKPVGVIWTGDPIQVPPEVLVQGRLRVSAMGFGDGGKTRLTTKRMEPPIMVFQSGPVETVGPEEATPELWEQVLALMGGLSNLNTDDESSLVAAINEVLAKVGAGGGGVSKEELTAAVNAALKQAKESGEFDGADGAPGKDGSDATVTTENIKNALGYTPADAETVSQLSAEIEALKGGGDDDYREETITPDIQGYLLMNGSYNNTTTKARRTDYISLEGCTRIKAQYRLATTGCAVAFFDSNKTFMSDVSIAGVGLGADTITEMEPPYGAAYVMLSHYLGSDLSYVGFITLTYGAPAIVYDSNLTGKTVNVLGDSISSVAYVTPNYWQRISQKTGCAFNDYAVSGTRIATVEGDGTESFLTRAARMDTTADAVLVMGGTNDVGLDTLLGEWNSDDTSTFYGALNALITLLRANFPGKPIIFCTPIKRKYDTDNGFPDTMADLKAASATEQITMQHCVLAIKAKCARHGIPVIDLSEHSGFSPLVPEYYRNADDNLHPSALGHVRIANMVQAELETQFLHTIE